MSQEEELLPCPFCGTGPEALVECAGYIACNGCNAFGPDTGDIEWNHRSRKLVAQAPAAATEASLRAELAILRALSDKLTKLLLELAAMLVVAAKAAKRPVELTGTILPQQPPVKTACPHCAGGEVPDARGYHELTDDLGGTVVSLCQDALMRRRRS